MNNIPNYLAYLLVRISRVQRQHAETELNKLGLHTGQEFILLRLWQEEGMTQTRLAEIMGVEPPTVTKMLHRMKGLVERRPDSEDARISRVYLTEEGRALHQKVLDFWRELEDLITDGLSEVEQTLLRRLLLQIYNNLGANNPGC